MNIIITGAAGFIGSNLSKKLLELGHRVTGIDNFSYGSELNIASILHNPHFRLIKGDLKNYETIEKCEGDIIVHLASQKIPRYTNALRTLTDNESLLKNVMKKCLKDKIRLVYASTSDVYGKNPNIPYSEESDLVMGKSTVKRWAYAISKIYGEQYIIANHDEYGLDYTITRFFGSYGINQNLSWWGGPQSVFIANALQKKPIEIHGDGLQTRTFTYVDDTVQGLIKCISEEKALNEIFNIASDSTEEITILDLGKTIWRLIHGEESHPLIEFIPYTTFGNYEDVKRRVPDITKIKELLGYSSSYPLEIGLALTIDWQKQIMGF